jgi:DeoR family fructose operon transcriptional repressor
MLSGLNVDKAFMTANNFSYKKGATTPDINQAETKKDLISIASNIILLCDSSKLGNTSFVQFATLEQIDKLVTDKIRDNDKKVLEESGVDVIVAFSD